MMPFIYPGGPLPAGPATRPAAVHLAAAGRFDGAEFHVQVSGMPALAPGDVPRA